MPRGKWSKPQDRTNVRGALRDPRGDKCVGCGKPFEPTHIETLCRDCIDWVKFDPDDWWDRLLCGPGLF